MAKLKEMKKKMYKRLEIEKRNSVTPSGGDHICLPSLNGSRFSNSVVSETCVHPLLGPTGDDLIESFHEKKFTHNHTPNPDRVNVETYPIPLAKRLKVSLCIYV